MNKMELTFSAVEENIAFSRTAVASFIVRYNPTIDDVIELKTIISEAVSNAIIHGYHYNQDCNVVVRVMIEDEMMRIEVEDFGEGILDIEAAKRPMYSSLENLEHAGMGLTIIENLSDYFEVESEPQHGCKLIIEKRLNSLG